MVGCEQRSHLGIEAMFKALAGEVEVDELSGQKLIALASELDLVFPKKMQKSAFEILLLETLKYDDPIQVWTELQARTV